MTNIQIDTNQVPQDWTFVGSSPARNRAASALVSSSQSVQALSPRAGEGEVLEAVKTLEHQLFDNRTELKVALSERVMHLPSNWRDIIFAQIDRLLDFEGWEEGESCLVKGSTFITFLRFVVFTNPTRLPSLGVGNTGHILAAWIKGNERMIAEFLPRDQASVSFVRDGARVERDGTSTKEVMAWRGHVAELKVFMERNYMIQLLQADSD